MAFITGKHLPRRTFLRGMGVSVALPLLDSMIPAGPGRSAVLPATPKRRLVCIEEVHGLAGCNDWASTQFLYAPEKVGRGFEMVAANPLKRLEPWQEYLTIVSNTDVRMAEAYSTREIGSDHERSSSVFLTQAHPRQSAGDVYVGTSLDQLHARRFGHDTVLPSLELGIENAGGGGGGYARAYTDSLSWASPTEPLPVIRDPRVVFERLFGAGDTQEDRAARRRANRSILDWILADVARLKATLEPTDGRAIDQYLESVREAERRIELVEQRNTSGDARELPEEPAGIPDSFDEHMQIMFDLQVLALQSDLTRVITFKTGRDASNRSFPASGMNKPFHGVSHHGNNQNVILELNTLNTYRVGQLTYFLEKLQGTMDGETHLLEQVAILWGSPMGDSNSHNHRRVPLILLGHADGRLEGNLHLRAPEGTPAANVMLKLLHELGHDDMESFGDSAGEFALTYARGATSAAASAG